MLIMRDDDHFCIHVALRAESCACFALCAHFVFRCGCGHGTRGGAFGSRFSPTRSAVSRRPTRHTTAHTADSGSQKVQAATTV
eukprot:2007826-Prymnesium_polylepis.2